MTGVHDNRKGAALMVASMAAFTIGDAFVKAIGDSLALSQILFLRGIVATAFIAGLVWYLGQMRLRHSRQAWGFVLLRCVAEIGAALCFFTALMNMKFANVSALLQMLPLTVTLGSALFFAEPVGWRRWSAIGVGFLGMLLIVRPGLAGFDSYSLVALGAVLCVTVRDLATKRIPQEVPSLVVTFAASLLVMGFAGAWSLVQDWQPIETRDIWLLLCASVCIVFAYLFSVMVMRVGDVGFIAPFRYTSLVLALLIGLLFFAEWPDTWSLIGAGVIVATGLFTLWRENWARKSQGKKA